jgi:hypothetical protein
MSEARNIPQEPTLTIFISHSSQDKAVALKLVELLRAALNLSADQIRCTSVDGYGLEAGAHSETQLREDVLSAKILIGLITPSSLSSAYVLFELGARWGAGKHQIPLLAGIEPKDLRGPLTALNAIPGRREQRLHEMVEDIAKILGQHVKGVGAYSKYVSELAHLSETATSRQAPSAGPRQATPNLIFIGARSVPASEIGGGVWSTEMGQFERKLLGEHGQLSLLARFTNEAQNTGQNVGVVVKAQLIYRSNGAEVLRIGGAWLDIPTEIAEFRVEDIRDLLIAVDAGNGPRAIEKQRVCSGVNGKEIKTDLHLIKIASNGTVTVRLTNAHNGDVLFEREFQLIMEPLQLTEAK